MLSLGWRSPSGGKREDCADTDEAPYGSTNAPASNLYRPADILIVVERRYTITDITERPLTTICFRHHGEVFFQNLAVIRNGLDDFADGLLTIRALNDVADLRFHDGTVSSVRVTVIFGNFGRCGSAASIDSRF